MTPELDIVGFGRPAVAQYCDKLVRGTIERAHGAAATLVPHRNILAGETDLVASDQELFDLPPVTECEDDCASTGRGLAVAKPGPEEGQKLLV